MLCDQETAWSKKKKTERLIRIPKQKTPNDMSPYTCAIATDSRQHRTGFFLPIQLQPEVWEQLNFRGLTTNHQGKEKRNARDMQTTTIYVPFFSHLHTYGVRVFGSGLLLGLGTGLLMARFAPSEGRAPKRPKRQDIVIGGA